MKSIVAFLYMIWLHIWDATQEFGRILLLFLIFITAVGSAISWFLFSLAWIIDDDHLRQNPWLFLWYIPVWIIGIAIGKALDNSKLKIWIFKLI